MRAAVTHPVNESAAATTRPDGWLARGRQLGFGVLLAFTIKGLCTTTLIVYTLLAGANDGGAAGVLPFLLVWLIVGVAGLALLRGGGAAVKQRR
jgi:hypothetical protein